MTDSVDRPLTPLRQGMLDDMALRDLRSDTQRDYIRFVVRFATFLGRPPDTATADDVRRFQLHQREQGAHLLEQDVDIRVIQVLLGHSKIDTTALYAKVATRTIHVVTSPLDRLMALMAGSAGAGAPVG